MDYAQIESSQRQFNEAMEHESRFRAAQISEEMALFAALRPSIKLDGDMWCVLFGDNLAEGIAGFGKTPIEAIRKFNAAMDKPDPKAKE
jgi:hypothetical protein